MQQKKTEDQDPTKISKILEEIKEMDQKRCLQKSRNKYIQEQDIGEIFTDINKILETKIRALIPDYPVYLKSTGHDYQKAMEVEEGFLEQERQKVSASSAGDERAGGARIPTTSSPSAEYLKSIRDPIPQQSSGSGGRQASPTSQVDRLQLSRSTDSPNRNRGHS